MYWNFTRLSYFIYKIVGTRPDFTSGLTEIESAVMVRHFDYLKELLHQGNLFLVGPCTDAAFGIVIFEAESLREAEMIAQNDPSVIEGVMSVEVHPYRISLLRGRD